MKKFIHFTDVQNNTWLINIDHIVSIEQYDGASTKSIINLSGREQCWMAEPVGEIYTMIEKHLEENEKANNK